MSPDTASTPPEVRPLDARDVPAMQQLFSEVFGHAMSPAFHDWKYRDGASCALGVFRNGELVAHYGGIGADISYFGRPARAVQIVDVMVKTAARQAVRKQSPFFLAGSAFLEQYIGYEQPYLLGYGFPSDRHMVLAERLGLYAPVGKMWELTWELPGPVQGPGWLRRLTRILPDDPGMMALDKLWLQLQHDLQQNIVVRKDAAHINRRYLQHPEKEYLVYLLTHSLTGTPRGAIVLKPEPDRMVLMDYVGPLQNLPELVRLARQVAVEHGCGSLSTWCGEMFTAAFSNENNKMFTAAFSNKNINKPAPADQQATTTTARTAAVPAMKALPITTPANIWTRGPAPAELHNRWWLMPGDTDFL